MSKVILSDSEDYDGDDIKTDKTFNVLIKKIERYMVDSQLSLVDQDSSNIDLFDLTVTGASKQLKFLLHPTLNANIYRGLLDINSVICVKKYMEHYNDSNLSPEKVIILEDIEVLEFTHENISTDKIVFAKTYRDGSPLVTSRNYYLPLYNDEDYYGKVWEGQTKPLVKTTLESLKSFTTIQQLYETNRTSLPLHGTVVSKSKLKNFGKVDDKKGKYPFTFSIEIEHNGITCSVSFWNNICFSYFTYIHVGDNILIKNYRVKRRYGKRSNTVYAGQDANLELSINSTNPKGIIELLEEKPSHVPYRFKTCKALNDTPFPLDTIFDVIGFITFLGRWEREKKTLTSGNSCQDFWMYRWICLKDNACSDTDLKIKLYACSQPKVLNHLAVGDIFVGTRMLYKISIISQEKTLKYYHHLTTTRESQLYCIHKDWKIGDIENLPFVKCLQVLNILKISHDEKTLERLLKDAYADGYYVYPPLPTTLRLFQQLFTEENSMEIVPTEKLAQICKNMHVYQSIRGICVQATVSAVEIIGDYDIQSQNRSMAETRSSRKRKLNESSRHLLGSSDKLPSSNDSEEERKEDGTEYPIRIIDKETIAMTDDMERIGDVDITDETKKNFLGSELIPGRKLFMRFLLTGLNKNVAILASFLPNTKGNCITNRSFIEVLGGLVVPDNYLSTLALAVSKGTEAIKKNDRFLFVLDLCYFGNEVLEVVVNRAYPLK